MSAATIIEAHDALAVLREMESDSVDAVITDPPYSSGGAFRGDRMNDTTSKYRADADGDLAPRLLRRQPRPARI